MEEHYVWTRTRPPAPGVHLDGSAAELWRGELQVGVLLNWTLDGADGAWTGAAKKCRASDALGGPLNVRFFWHQLEIVGRGFALWDEQGGIVLRGTGLVVKGAASYGEHHQG